MTSTSQVLLSTPAAALPQSENRRIAFWLLGCCTLVFVMVVVGGITRLTHSGLSITEWQPIVGALPPLNADQWEQVFSLYRQTPQYRLVNAGMTLEQFKGIFWWEYIHRLLGRVIGLAFLLPLVWFAWRGRIERSLIPRLAGLFVLGGLQGALGWYMVQSGLVDDPRVSQYRLTAHLGLAVLIYGALLWVALDLLFPRRPAIPATGDPPAVRRSLRRWANALAGLVFVMILSGGLVAGIRAGFAYNTFPLMNGHVLPPEAFVLQPWYLNFFSNMATVQFDHRLLAWLLALLVPWFWLKSRRVELAPRARRACDLLPALLFLQIALGISTLLLHVPLPLAAAHQAGAMLVFTGSVFAAHSLR
jgi:cytochrome c oxidase assembly protein subunit 15